MSGWLGWVDGSVGGRMSGWVDGFVHIDTQTVLTFDTEWYVPYFT